MMKNNITFEIELSSLKFLALTPEKRTNMKGDPRRDDKNYTLENFSNENIKYFR